MKRLKWVNLIVVASLALTALTALVSSPVYAAKQAVLEPVTVVIEDLPDKSERLDQNTVVTEISNNGKVRQLRAEISLIPETMPDLETEIVCEWRAGMDIDGVPYLTNGNNLFWARITGTRVSVEYDGKQAAWDPQILIGGTYMTLEGGPFIVNDPLNSNYVNNSIKWVYTCKKGGFLGIGAQKITVLRYVRQIEGSLLEYYVLLEAPGNNDIQIKQNYEEEGQFIWDKPVCAWDATNTPIPVREQGYGKAISKEDLQKATYPVVIDPTTSFTTSASDGDCSYVSSTWAATRTAATASGCGISAPTSEAACQTVSGVGSFIYRGYLYFDTSSIGSASTITSATLKLYNSGVSNPEAASIYISGGMPTYPHDPLVVADYNYAYYSGDYAHIALSAVTVGYNSLSLTAAGLSAISKTGTTKFVVRTSQDYTGTGPTSTDATIWYYYAYEQGTGYQPKLEVTYTTPVSVPTVTTNASSGETSTGATIAGYLSSDGGATCSVAFDYGLTTSYAYVTSWQSGKTTGTVFTADIAGLSQGTLYHYRAKASNSAGTGYGNDSSLLTKPDAPTAFTVTPGNTNNSLAWTKGTGSVNTSVRFSTATYPTSISEGTEIYFGPNASYVHTSLTNGIPYYYSIWGYQVNGSLSFYSTGYATGSGTPFVLGKPTVTTYAATNVSTTGADLNGYLDSLMGAASATCWFDYGLNTSYGSTTSSTVLTDIGQFTKSVSGLSTSTTYHFRAVAQSSEGVTNGSDATFTTGGPSAPSMTTQTATAVTKTSATLNGLVVSDGNASVTGWFQWGATESYGYTTASASGLYTDDTLYAALSSLTTNTTYHYRVVGQNSAGIGYGLDNTFTTDSPDAPTCSTQDATAIGSTSAILHGTIVSDGGVTCDVRFQYGATGVYGTDTGWMSGYSTDDTFQVYISGLTAGDTYYFRAQVKNSEDTGSGTEKQFTTQFGPPSPFKATSTSQTSILLTWTSVGDQTGVFGKAGSFPADRLDGDPAYFGTADSVTASGLSSGTTYFYRAWSWTEGDTWSVAYSEDAATTMTSSSVSNPAVPDVVGEDPTMPSQYFQEPSGASFADWPGYELIETAATESGIPSGSLWLILALVICVAFGIIVYQVTGSIVLMVIAMCVVIGVSAILGVVPLWVMIVFILMACSLGVLMGQRA
jgi:hypothetical protein